MATMSILGVYNYDESVMDGLWNNLPAPDGFPEDMEHRELQKMNKDVLMGRIVAKCAELEFLYPRPSFAKTMIELWATGKKQEWQGLYNTLYYKYNPIWNRDGTETYTKKYDENYQSNRTDISNGTNELTVAEKPGDTMAHEVTGYNDNTPRLASQDVRSGTNTEESAGAGTYENIGNETGGRSYSENYENKSGGNIGVTMTQQMIEYERNVVEFNLYDKIATDFMLEFCLLMY